MTQSNGFGDLLKNLRVGDVLSAFVDTAEKTAAPPETKDPVTEVPDRDVMYLNVLEDIATGIKAVAEELHDANQRARRRYGV